MILSGASQWDSHLHYQCGCGGRYIRTGPFEPLFEMLDPRSQAPEFSLIFFDFLGLLLNRLIPLTQIGLQTMILAVMKVLVVASNVEAGPGAG
jgi:hypothetical protein